VVWNDIIYLQIEFGSMFLRYGLVFPETGAAAISDFEKWRILTPGNVKNAI